jgi:hypothetical protein
MFCFMETIHEPLHGIRQTEFGTVKITYTYTSFILTIILYDETFKYGEILRLC